MPVAKSWIWPALASGMTRYTVVNLYTDRC